MAENKVLYCCKCGKETVHQFINRDTHSNKNDIVKDILSNLSETELSNNFYRCEECGNIQRQ